MPKATDKRGCPDEHKGSSIDRVAGQTKAQKRLECGNISELTFGLEGNLIFGSARLRFWWASVGPPLATAPKQAACCCNCG